MESTLDLQVLTPADWSLLRSARLDALRDSPRAFISRYDVEGNWGETEWRRSMEASTWIIARNGDRAIGLAKSVTDFARPSVRYLESIWVDPTHRGRGVFRALLHKLAKLEHQLGASQLLLWVLEDNDAAQYAYAALGFEATGNRQRLPGLDRHEVELGLQLTPEPELA